MSDVTYLTLPTWIGGSLSIRFIYLVNNTSFRLTECPNKGPAIPLYLGADLFSNTDVRTENHPRQHAKFAKKGLATKLHFSSVYRFHGLKVPTSNNSLWFYSVQGLFRIAFEFFSKQDQLALLENFQDIWKSHINDAPLQMGYSLSEQLDFAVVGEEPAAKEPRTKEPRSVIFKPLQAVPTSVEPGDSSKDHNYCSHPHQSQETDPNPDLFSPFQQQIHRMADKLPQIQPEQLKTVRLLLDLIDSYITGNLNEHNVTEAVMALLQAKKWDGVYSSHLLSCIGRWLGQQFHEANSSISQRVEGFKIHHIDRISDLPPAEELTQELFPEAMTSLLLHWMGLSEEASVDKRHSEYPILLLILEFANHNLITGVAHVLYSSLICK
ncbi:uncharacterized protein si:ch211-110p13.9 [Boleophthalmus pectinirostris]|uniref:uncharacterized protein si:ch211-110p13.9 n=1 Tax=Boleophthalmus pectinirostris TaxID=150288 RepID=UPI000A1C31D9|nr:uncharacterized protein si:ch211-110p13.9 [Boleophthalmus pectinirostris]